MLVKALKLMSIPKRTFYGLIVPIFLQRFDCSLNCNIQYDKYTTLHKICLPFFSTLKMLPPS